MSESAEPKPNILVVDDDEAIRDLLDASLTRHGFQVATADGGVAMDSVLKAGTTDLIILDTMMPGEDGLSICQRVSSAKGPPIIMLSAAGDDVARIKGLNLGAEDYMAKPFNLDELALRIRIVLRRSPARETSDIVSFFGWSLDNRTRRLTSPIQKYIVLSAAEFAVMHVFLAQPDRPLKREQVLARMAEMHQDSTGRSLDTLISRLRKKLSHIAAADEDDLIQTVYGTGYMFRPQKAV